MVPREDNGLGKAKAKAIRGKAKKLAQHEGIGLGKALKRARRSVVLIQISRDGGDPCRQWKDRDWIHRISNETGVSAGFVRRVVNGERLKAMIKKSEAHMEDEE